jgi:hypothetical protein
MSKKDKPAGTTAIQFPQRFTEHTDSEAVDKIKEELLNLTDSEVNHIYQWLKSNGLIDQ